MMIDKGVRQLLIQIITAFVGGMIAVVLANFIRSLLGYIRSHYWD